ncbi:mitochondrial amidoxime reducing component 2 [Epargyreus clarus]|uniref:mitochondrial amidoxime reducing component 2 n=1 Tax=Epargyreus clarus TaxID=520877 RepID=UPI003C30CA12
MFNQNIQAHYVTAAIATAGVLGAGYAYYRYQKNKLPTVWTHVGKLEDLYVYPIKSCGPVTVDRADCTYLGLKDGWLRDRVLMVVDEKNHFINARVYPELLLVRPTVKSSILTLRHVDMEPLYVNLAEVIELQKPFKATVWTCTVPVLDCGREASEWFSKLLNRADIKFRLVYYSNQKCRELRDPANIKYYKFRDTDTGALPDESSFNLINKASIDDLNSRLGDVQVDHRYFRPNFTVKGPIIYDEDKWKFVKIGESVFEVLKPCTRCIMTTIDPETGIRNPKTEPLEMLRSYRLMEDPVERKFAGNSPRMGIQMALRSGIGKTINLHDDVYVSYN